LIGQSLIRKKTGVPEKETRLEKEEGLL
jgi:hypothetical protein